MQNSINIIEGVAKNQIEGINSKERIILTESSKMGKVCVEQIKEICIQPDATSEIKREGIAKIESIHKREIGSKEKELNYCREDRDKSNKSICAAAVFSFFGTLLINPENRKSLQEFGKHLAKISNDFFMKSESFLKNTKLLIEK